MDKVRFGIIGLGNMGKSHTKNFLAGKVPEAELTAVCDTNPEKIQAAKELFGEEHFRYFDDAETMMSSGLIDAILIAIPHYLHPEMAIRGFAHGLHVMTEKPAGVYTRQVREMNEAAAKSDRKFGIMFQHRGEPIYRKMHDMVQSGELGDLKRINLIFTDWYRSQAYYDSGTWRATWGGEGGGVLVNQCPHSLDLWQWIVGMMPTRVSAFCHEGKWHRIEVEDDVSAYLEYPNCATCLFTTCTADAPGINRIELTGDRGRLLAENGKLTFYKLEMSERAFNATTKEGFRAPAHEVIEVPLEGEFQWHPYILCNFCAAILRDEPLYIPGEEGIKGLTLSNAIMLSSWLGRPVELPLDEDLFYDELNKRIARSSFDGVYR